MWHANQHVMLTKHSFSDPSLCQRIAQAGPRPYRRRPRHDGFARMCTGCPRQDYLNRIHDPDMKDLREFHTASCKQLQASRGSKVLRILSDQGTETASY